MRVPVSTAQAFWYDLRMSVGFSAWNIDIRFIQSLYGWKNNERYEALTRALELPIAELARSFAREIASGRQPAPADAFRHIIEGHYPHDATGAVYAYVVQSLVDKWGRSMPNAALMPCGSEFPAKVDAALAAMGIDAFRLLDLSNGKLPLPLPPIDDYPGFGHLTPVEVRAAHQQFANVEYAGHDEEIADAIECIRKWLKLASKLKTTGLIAFFG
jgi:hypothetical protein